MQTIKSKRRLFALLLAFTTMVGILIPLNVAHADGLYSGGGWAKANDSATVYKYSNLTVSKGTIYAGEGFTVLEYLGSGVAHVQYSAPGGAKDGYITYDDADAMICTNWTCVAKANSNTPIYYCNSTQTFQQSGTIYANELVAVIGKSGDWSLIEYNTDSGKRKRGYVVNSNLTYYGEPSAYLQFFHRNNYTTTTVSGTIYTGPTNKYTQVTTVSNQSVRLYTNSYDNYAEGVYVSFIPSGATKRIAGYLIN